MADSLLSNQRQDTVTYVAERLVNAVAAGEGTLLPPRQQGPGRVPIVTGLAVTVVENYLGGTQFTLIWNDPADPQNIIAGYNVYATVQGGSATLLASVDASPATVRVVSNQAQVVVFTVQTVLVSGNVSSLDYSPSCTSRITAPVLSNSDIGAISVTTISPGSANQLAGTNPGGTASEWKSLSGTTNQIDVTFGGGSITLALDPQVILQALALSFANTAAASYTAANTTTTVFADATSNNVTVTTPPGPKAGQLFIVKRVDSSGHTVTAAANSGQTIEVTAVGAAKAIVFQYDSGASEWRAIAQF